MVAIETLFFCSALGMEKIKKQTVLFSRQYNVIRKWGSFKKDAQNFSKEDYTQVSRKE
jgi:hypothetical protein